MKRVTITFDFEGTWGMPHNSAYDLAESTNLLLEVLKNNNAQAVFFITGKLIEQYPEIIRLIHVNGHEIGFHGYTHEHMHNLTPSQLNELVLSLAATAKELSSITGYAPKGFRAPYLMGPIFYDAAVYKALSGQSYTWISNREIRFPEELFRPDRLKLGYGLLKIRSVRKLLLVALNARLIFTENHFTGQRYVAAVSWLLGPQNPYLRPDSIIEYPLTSPLDCDLLGFPEPQTPSGHQFVAYATRTITDCYDKSGLDFNINCHDWITGTADRSQVLDSVLKHINASGEAIYYRPGLDGATQ